jgi:hypothetical protein
MKKFTLLLTILFTSYLHAIPLNNSSFLRLKKEIFKLGAKREKKKELNSKIKLVENSLMPSVTLDTKIGRRNIKRQMKKHGIGAISLAIINDNEIEWAKGYGYFKNSKRKVRVNKDTLFETTHFCKTLGAIAALYLADKSNISIDDDVKNIIKKNNSSNSDDSISLKKILKTVKEYNSLGILEFNSKYLNSNFDSIINFIEWVSNDPFPITIKNVLLEKFSMESSSINIIDVEKSKEIDSYSFLTTAQDLASLLINVNDKKNENNFPLKVLEKIMDFSKPNISPNKLDKSPFFGISMSDEDFSCMMVKYENKGAVILTNNKNGNLLSEEIIRSISKTYNWPNFSPDLKKIVKKQIVKNDK